MPHTCERRQALGDGHRIGAQHQRGLEQARHAEPRVRQVQRVRHKHHPSASALLFRTPCSPATFGTLPRCGMTMTAATPRSRRLTA